MQREGGGPVTFTVGSDDGVRLYVNGNMVIDDWSAHDYREASVTVNLSPGKHHLRLSYWERTGHAEVTFHCDSDVLVWQES